MAATYRVAALTCQGSRSGLPRTDSHRHWPQLEANGALSRVDAGLVVSRSTLGQSLKSSLNGSFKGRPLLTRSQPPLLSTRIPRATSAAGKIDLVKCSPVLEDSLLNNMALWLLEKCKASHDVLERVLPGSIHDAIHVHEYAAAVCIRESVIALISLVLFLNVEKACRALDWVWMQLFERRGSLMVPDETMSEDSSAEGDTSIPFEERGLGAAVRPLKFLILALFMTRHVRLLIPFMKMQLRPVAVRKLRASALALALTNFFVAWKERLLKRLLKRNPKGKPILSTMSRFLSLFIRTVCLATLLELWGIHFRSLLAVGGVSGVAIGFASKEIFSNFFGGLVLFFTRPFVVGNSIKAGSVAGFVTEIGFLQTKLEGFDCVPIVVPNSMFLTAVITNSSKSSGRMFDGSIDIRTEDAGKVKAICDRITAMLRGHTRILLGRSSNMAYLKGVGPHSIQIGISAAFQPMRSSEFTALKHDVMQQVVKAATQEGATLGANPMVQPASQSTNGAHALNH